MRTAAPDRIDFALRALAREVDLLRAGLADAKPLPSTPRESLLHNPAVLAVLGVVGTIATGIWQLHASRELEREKLRSSLIQEASKSDDQAKTLRNLRFLVKSGLLTDEGGQIAQMKAEDAPSFTSELTKPMTRQEMAEAFGNPKLAVKEGAGWGAFGVPDAAWVAENLVDVALPEMKGVAGFPASGRIKFHRKAADALKAVVAEIAERGLLHRIESFNGAFAPRTLPGGVYSAHAFGIALDLNVAANPLGGLGAPAGAKGSLRELVPIFEKHGFYWGGHFARPDPNHFQFGVKTERIVVVPGASASAAAAGRP